MLLSFRSYVPDARRALFAVRAIVRQAGAQRRWHCDDVPRPNATNLSVVFVDTKSGKRSSVTCLEGENLLHVAHKNAIDLEGACECSVACSTCHVMLTPAVYDLLAEPTDAEQDMLDLAYGLTATYVSRMWQDLVQFGNYLIATLHAGRDLGVRSEQSASWTEQKLESRWRLAISTWMVISRNLTR